MNIYKGFYIKEKRAKKDESMFSSLIGYEAWKTKSGCRGKKLFFEDKLLKDLKKKINQFWLSKEVLWRS